MRLKRLNPSSFWTGRKPADPRASPESLASVSGDLVDFLGCLRCLHAQRATSAARVRSLGHDRGLGRRDNRHVPHRRNLPARRRRGPFSVLLH